MSESARPAAHHIATYAQRLDGGGVERALLWLMRGWCTAGRRVTLILGSSEGPLAHELPDAVEVIELGDTRYRAMYALPRILPTVAPDLLFCPGNHYTSVAAWTRLRMGSHTPPIVAKVSNALVRPEMRGLEGWGYPHWLRLHPHFIDWFVAMSPAMAEETVRMTGMPRDRVSAVADPAALPVPGASQAPLPLGRYIVGAGRLEPQKRWDRLIAALPRLADPEVSLLLLGEGSLRGALEAQVAALGLEGRVSMPGHVGDALPALAGAQVAVLTSDFEGVPGVMREALSQGTPMVVTESSVGIREVVHSPDLGTVIPRGDADALIAALDHWLAPGVERPAPVLPDGATSATDYLAIFDRLVAQRSR